MAPRTYSNYEPFDPTVTSTSTGSGTFTETPAGSTDLSTASPSDFQRRVVTPRKAHPRHSAPSIRRTPPTHAELRNKDLR